MALKPDRNEIETDVTYFAATITGPDANFMERGTIVCSVTTSPGSGAAMDSAGQAVQIVNASGQLAVGILLNDVVNIDQSRQIVNPYKSEAQVGNKVLIGKKGWWVTNKIAANQGTGNVPTNAYVTTSGLLTDVSGAGLPLVGRFLSRKDADGYCKVAIDLP